MKYYAAFTLILTLICVAVYFATGSTGAQIMTLTQSISYGLGIVFGMMTIALFCLHLIQKNKW